MGARVEFLIRASRAALTISGEVSRESGSSSYSPALTPSTLLRIHSVEGCSWPEGWCGILDPGHTSVGHQDSA